MSFEYEKLQPPQTGFQGREAEIAWLRRAWNEAVRGTPQMRILAAESGYGKTRIVQEFYAWLSAHQDPENYWPSALAEEGQNLRVMPHVEMVERGKDKKAPWFWWGMRWIADPDGRNLPEEISPFISSIHEPSFISHQSALLLSVNERQALSDALVASGKVLLGIAGVSAAQDLVDAVDQIQTFLGIVRKHRSGVDLAKGKEAAEAQELERILTTFALLLDPSKGNKGSLPVVLVLDDAHWIDAFSLKIVERLWREATDRKWPLLVVATTWQSEWNKAAGIGNWAKAKLQNNTDNLALMQVKRLDQENIERLFKMSFPGLTGDQRLFFAGKADGNPRHAMEICMLLRDMADDWFEQGDVGRCLTNEGFVRARREELDLERLEARRFRKVEGDVKDALAAGSAQGEVFLCDFALDIARELGLRGSDTKALEKAETPFALAEALDSESMEFRSSLIHRLAKEHLSLKTSKSGLSDAIGRAAESWMAAGKIGKLRADLANKILGFYAASSTRRETEVDATAQALALFHEEPSGWYLAQWRPRWMQIKPSTDELKAVPPEILRNVSKALWEAGEREEALRIMLELERHLESSPDAATLADCIVLSTTMLSELKAATDESIEKQYVRVVDLRANVASTTNDAESLRKLAQAHYAYGRFLVLRADAIEDVNGLAQAGKQLQEAVDAARKAYRMSDSEDNLLSLAFSLRYQAEFLRLEAKDFPMATKVAGETVDTYKQLIKRSGATPRMVQGLAYALFTQASVESDQEDYQAAIDLLDEAVNELESLNEGGITPSRFSIYATCLRKKAYCLMESDNADSVLPCLQTALQACEKALEITPGHPDLLESKEKLSARVKLCAEQTS